MQRMILALAMVAIVTTAQAQQDPQCYEWDGQSTKTLCGTITEYFCGYYCDYNGMDDDGVRTFKCRDSSPDSMEVIAGDQAGDEVNTYEKELPLGTSGDQAGEPEEVVCFTEQFCGCEWDNDEKRMICNLPSAAEDGDVDTSPEYEECQSLHMVLFGHDEGEDPESHDDDDDEDPAGDEDPEEEPEDPEEEPEEEPEDE